MGKNIISFFICTAILFSSVFAAAPSAKIGAADNAKNIYIEGRTDYVTPADKYVTLLLTNQKGDIEYIGQYDIAENGTYSAKFKFNKDTSNLTLSVKAGTHDVTKGVEIARVTKDAQVFDINLKSNGNGYITSDGKIDISGAVKNYVCDAGECKILTVLYKQDKMINAHYDTKYITYDVTQPISLQYASEGADRAKVMIWQNLKSIMPLAPYSEISNQTYASDRLADENSEITIAFLGGSITEGIGSSYDNSEARKNSYAYLAAEWFKEKYAKVNYYNAGIGGTDSLQGAFRIQNDIANVNPDVVFVEFCVNDNWKNGADCTAANEAIFRQLMNLPKQPVIIYVMTVGKYSDNRGKNYPNTVEWMKNLCNRYSVGYIDIYGYANSDKFTSFDGFVNQYIKKENDMLHPNDDGHKLYADYIKTCLDENYGNYIKKYTDIPEAQYAKYDNPKLVPVTDENVILSDGWELEEDTVTKATYPTFTSYSDKIFTDGLIKSSKAGSRVTFKFSGNVIGIYKTSTTHNKWLEYSIDGGAVTGKITRELTTKLKRAEICEIANNLDDGEHTITLTVCENAKVSSDESNCNREHSVEIGYFTVNE